MVLGLIILMFGGALIASAHGHNGNSNGHNNQHGHNQSGGSGRGGNSSGGNSGGSGSTPPPVTPPPVVPPVIPPPVTSPVAGEVRFEAFTTGYSDFDNTPGGSNATNLGGISGTTGGIGTYADPITLAVGGSIINGKEIDDYPYGTKFYVPNLRKYFEAEDFCGDGNNPQSGPCHTGFQGHVWVDLFVGGPNTNVVTACEDNITDLHLVIENPASNYAVVPGAVYDTGCQQYGDSVLSS